MNRLALGAFGALLLVAAGLFWWQARAELDRAAPPPDLSGSGVLAGGPIMLPTAEPHGRGPQLPGAGKSVQSKEERRFARYDRNRNGQIERAEMLATRVKAFQKLDSNHDNLLTFEEWAVKTADRFKAIDRNGDGVVSRAELDAWYAAKDAKLAARARQPRCTCASKSAGKEGGKPAPSDDDGEPAD